MYHDYAFYILAELANPSIFSCAESASLSSSKHETGKVTSDIPFYLVILWTRYNHSGFADFGTPKRRLELLKDRMR